MISDRLASTTLSLILFFLLFHPQVGRAQSNQELEALKKEIEELKENQKILRREFEAIKNLFRGRQVPLQQEFQNLILGVDGSPFKGDKNAPLTLIEFSDYQCPFCARHFQEVFPRIESDYIKTGKVRYVFRDFPIESVNLQAFRAAEAAHCAGEQGKFWEMHDRLFANQSALGSKHLSQHAQALGLDLANFQECLDRGRQGAKIRKDMADGERAGIRGTPMFFIGRAQPKDTKIKVLRVLRGSQSYSTFKEILDSLLGTQR